MPDPSDEPAAPARDLPGLALVFLKLGVIGFGGPAAHVALMEREFVARRRWLSPERFLDLLGTASLIPGPSSSELAVFIGWERAGLAGLLVAGTCFVLPAAVLSGLAAWAYVRFGSLPRVAGVLHGVKPVVIAIVAQAIWSLAPRAVKGSWRLAVLGVLAAALAVARVDALALLAGAGALSLAGHAWRARTRPGPGPLLALLPVGGLAPAAVPAAAGHGAITLVFLKLGAVVFGSGYVLLAFLRADLVERLHWLTEAQLLDAVAVGQVTPGPVFTTATFIGYVLAGFPGAVLATVAIFLPGFVLVAAVRPLVARVRRSPGAAAFLDGVNVASLALMAVVAVQLARGAVTGGFTASLALASAVLLIRFRVNPTWLIAGGALAGVLAGSMR